jgi:hypothetical protein
MDTVQPYVYTGDDPLNATDPLGLSPEKGNQGKDTTGRGEAAISENLAKARADLKKAIDGGASARVVSRLKRRVSGESSNLKALQRKNQGNKEQSIRPGQNLFSTTPSAELGPRQTPNMIPQSGFAPSNSGAPALPSPVTPGISAPTIGFMIIKALAAVGCGAAAGPETGGAASGPAGAACFAAAP